MAYIDRYLLHIKFYVLWTLFSIPIVYEVASTQLYVSENWGTL